MLTWVEGRGVIFTFESAARGIGSDPPYNPQPPQVFCWCFDLGRDCKQTAQRRSGRLTRTRESLCEVKERLVWEQQIRTVKKLLQLGLQFEVVRERRLFYGLSWSGVFVSVLLGVSLVVSFVYLCVSTPRARTVV